MGQTVSTATDLLQTIGCCTPENELEHHRDPLASYASGPSDAMNRSLPPNTGSLDKLEPEDRKKVEAFLRKNEFLNVNDRKMVGGKWGVFYYPLHKAVAKDDADIVRLLLEAGADPNKKDADKKTAHDLVLALLKDGHFLDPEIIQMVDPAARAAAQPGFVDSSYSLPA